MEKERQKTSRDIYFFSYSVFYLKDFFYGAQVGNCIEDFFKTKFLTVSGMGLEGLGLIIGLCFVLSIKQL